MKVSQASQDTHSSISKPPFVYNASVKKKYLKRIRSLCKAQIPQI